MQAHQLKPPPGAKHAKKRIGRGNASGHGTYSTRGLKGQKSRAGHKPRRYFEGGQTELMRRLPRKRGFTNHFRVDFTAVNLRDLARFDDGADVTPELLKQNGIVSSLRKPIKVLGTGDISRKLNVTAHKFSMAAREKIEAAGGTATALMPDIDKKAAHPKRKRASKKTIAAAKAKVVADREKDEAAETEGKGKKGAKAAAPAEDAPETEAQEDDGDGS